MTTRTAQTMTSKAEQLRADAIFAIQKIRSDRSISETERGVVLEQVDEFVHRLLGESGAATLETH